MISATSGFSFCSHSSRCSAAQRIVWPPSLPYSGPFHSRQHSGRWYARTRAADGEDPSSWEVRECRNVTLSGCQIVNARMRGIAIHGSSVVRVSDSTIRGGSGNDGYRMAIEADPTSTELMVVNNFLGKGSEGDLRLPRGAASHGNVTL